MGKSKGLSEILAHSFPRKCDLAEYVYILYDSDISTDLYQGSNSKSVMLR